MFCFTAVLANWSRESLLSISMCLAAKGVSHLGCCSQPIRRKSSVVSLHKPAHISGEVAQQRLDAGRAVVVLPFHNNHRFAIVTRLRDVAVRPAALAVFMKGVNGDQGIGGGRS